MTLKINLSMAERFRLQILRRILSVIDIDAEPKRYR